MLETRFKTLLLLTVTSLFLQPTKSQANINAKPEVLHLDELRIDRQANDFFVEVSVNGVTKTKLAQLKIRNNQYYLPEAYWQHLELDLPDTAPLNDHGKTFYRLPLEQGIEAKLDPLSLKFDLTIPPEFYQASHLKRDYQKLTPEHKDAGGYLNYDIVYDVFDEEQNSNGTFSVNAFGEFGTFYSEELFNVSNDQPDLVRLNSRWRYDDSESMKTLIIGDTNSIPGSWGNSVLYGGIQWRSNFSVQPNFAPYPTMPINGQAVLPSTVELYLENVNLLRQEVRPGPFVIDFQPPAVGQGNVRLVTTDILGRQTSLTLPFYASRALLKPGLHEYGFDIGVIRENYGLEDFDYHKFFMSGVDAFGINDRVTLELKGELQRDHQTFGQNVRWLSSERGSMYATTAVSNQHGASGGYLAYGFEYRNQQFNFGFNTEFESEKFITLGERASSPSFVRSFQANAGYTSLGYGSIHLNYLTRVNRDNPNAQVVSIGYTKSLGKSWSLSMSAVGSIAKRDESSVYLNLNYLIDRAHISSFQSVARKEDQQATLRLSKSTPPQGGAGYDFMGTAGDTNQHFRGRFNYLSKFADSSLQYAHYEHHGYYRLNTQGSVSLLRSKIYLSPQITDSFAVVHAPGQANMAVYQEHRKVAETDDQGYALLPRLLSYHRNKITIDGEKLPLNVKASSTKYEAIPYYRSGVFVPFHIVSSRSAFFTVVDPIGQPLPPGTTVFHKHDYQAGEFGNGQPLGYGGELYFSGLQETNTLLAKWHDSLCQFDLSVAPSDEPIMQLPQQTCYPLQ